MTTDIDGSPILCITVDEAEEIWLALRRCQTPYNKSVLEKIEKFLNETDEREKP